MKIKKMGMAGTLESSDVSIVVEPNPSKGIEIQLKSSVEKQFGKQIKKVILETLEATGVEDALVRVNDKGALDCVIKARLQAATYRAADSKDYQWEV